MADDIEREAEEQELIVDALEQDEQELIAEINREVEPDPEPEQDAEDADAPDTETAEEDAGEQDEPEPEAEQDDEPDDFEDVDRPTPDDWKRMRERYKALKAERRQTAQQKPDDSPPAADFEIPGQEQPPTRPQPAPRQSYDGEALLALMARAESGEDDNAAEVLRQAWQAVGQGLVAPQTIRNAVLRAKQGLYGERSEDIARLGAEALQIASGAYEEARQATERQAQAERTRAASWNEVLRQAPQLQDRNSEQFRAFASAQAELRQVVPDLWTRPDAPQTIARYMGLKQQAAQSQALQTERDRLAAENADLRKRLGIRDGGPKGGQRPRKAPAPMTAEQELAREFAALGV